MPLDSDNRSEIAARSNCSPSIYDGCKSIGRAKLTMNTQRSKHEIRIILRCAWFERLTDMQSKGRDRTKIKLESFVILCTHTIIRLWSAIVRMIGFSIKKNHSVHLIATLIASQNSWLLNYRLFLFWPVQQISFRICDAIKNSQSAINWLSFCPFWARLFSAWHYKSHRKPASTKYAH